MVTRNISGNISSETAGQQDIYLSKKADRLSNQQHLLLETVRQCVKVYQFEPRDCHFLSGHFKDRGCRSFSQCNAQKR
jgi:hypothetical protein